MEVKWCKLTGVYSNTQIKLPKLNLTLKLALLIVLIACFKVSAMANAQGINLVLKNVPLETAFSEIKRQSGYGFWYDKADLNQAAKISISIKNGSLKETLDQCFKSQALVYEIFDKTIVVKRKTKNITDKVTDFIKSMTIKGKVTDEKAMPMAAVTVRLKDTEKTTVTNDAGEFVMEVPDENAVLQFSYLGFAPFEQALKNSQFLNVVLKEEQSELKAVEINAGYYTVKDRERTGSISRITSKDIENQPINNVLAAMQANITGVQVTQNTGVPGGGFTVQVRGRNSISNGNNPFYIIDGVPFTLTGLGAAVASTNITANPSPLASINPADIESIEVLKDADATAIYGSRGANGVILITTKRGKSGKVQTSFSINQGFSSVAKKLDLMNTDQYLEMRRESLKNDNLQMSTTDYDLNGAWDPARYTDWQKELIGETAPLTNIQGSISGGSENVTYLMGGNYYREATVYPGDNIYSRGSGNFNLQYTSDNKKLNTSFSANYSQINSDLFSTDLTQFITLAPNYPTLQSENGVLNWGNNTMYVNPIANTLQSYKAKTNNIIGNAMLNYAIIKEFKIKASLGFSKMDRKEFSSFPLESYSPAFNYGEERRISDFTNNSTNTWIMETQAELNKNFGAGVLNMLIGTTFQENLIDIQKVRGTGYTSDVLMGNIASASTLSIPNRDYFRYRYMAIFGRINYIFKEKYIVNITGRRDGSSRFGTDNRFANFGAIGLAWLVSSEGFIKSNLPFINFAKLRGSYGITGNDQISDYGYLELWRPSQSYQNTATMFPGSLKNPNYAWEVNKKAEIALEFRLLKDKINISAGYYSNRSSNQLVRKQLTPSTGFSVINDNLPATVENIGWEFELGTKNVSNKLFSWSTSINLTIPKNKLINYPGLATSSDANTYIIGQPLSTRKLFNTSVDPATGLYQVEDRNHNGAIDFENDAYLTKFVGREFYGGLLNSFSYKGLELDFTFQFVKQSGTGYSNTFNLPGALFPQSSTTNQPVELLVDRWINLGDRSKYQKFSGSLNANTSLYYAETLGNLAIEDASFIRLKNISLSYNFPMQFLKAAKLNHARFFLQGQNLFTLTPYKGLDPETLSGYVLPTLRVFTAGIQLAL